MTMKKTAEKQHFDNISLKYMEQSKSWNDTYTAINAEMVPRIAGKVVLDIGNGGMFPYPVQLPARVIAFDISPQMLARIEDPCVEKIEGDARNLDGIPDQSVDIILFSLAIHHINGPTQGASLKILSELLVAAHKKLKPEGELIIVEQTIGNFQYVVESFLFPFTRWLLSLFGVSMVFMYSKRILVREITKAFSSNQDEVSIKDIRQTGMIDVLGGTFPGVLMVPAFLFPFQPAILRVKRNTDDFS